MKEQWLATILLLGCALAASSNHRVMPERVQTRPMQATRLRCAPADARARDPAGLAAKACPTAGR